MSEPIVATFVLILLLSVGEFVSIWTHARIPMLMVAMFGYLILTWTGIFPEDLTGKSNLPVISGIVIPPLILHMGTLMRFETLKAQWRAVIIAVGGVVGALVLVLVVASLIFDFPTAASGIGPIAGGVVALLITTERLQEIGLTSIIVIPVMIQAFQGPVGMPITTFFMRRYSKHFLKNKENILNEAGGMPEEKEHTGPSILDNNIILLTIIFAFGALATILGDVTPIHPTLFALFFGILLVNFRVLPRAALEKSNSFGFLMTTLLIVIIDTMGGITPQDVLNHIPAVAVILVIGVIGLLIGGFISAKIVGWHHDKAIPVALTALLGFPADYILCEEVARSETNNSEDENLLFEQLVTPMIIGGFVTVTISSVVIASIIMSFI